MTDKRTGTPTWVNAADWLSVALVGLAVLVLTTGGFRETLAGIRISLTSPWRPALLAAVLLLLRHCAWRRPTLLHRAARAARWLAAFRRFARPAARVCLPILGLAVLAAPAILYAAIALRWDSAKLCPVTGDEPHYLIVADAIVQDGTLDVAEAYRRDAIERRIIGPIDWQRHSRTLEAPAGSREIAGPTYSIHNVGLPVFVAPLFAARGVPGARVTIALAVGVLPFLFYLASRGRGLPPGEAVGLGLVLSFGLPFLAAAGQIYPDLLAGVILAGAATVALAFSAGRPVRAAAVIAAGLALAALPWLHVKSIVPAALMALTLAWQAKGGRRAWRASAWLFAPLTVSLALLVCYHLVAFGSPWGSYTREAAAGASAGQALMIFLGLHLDQAQGIFAQHPFLLFGLAGVPVFFARARSLALATGLVYASIIVPNSLHPVWYGGFSMSGRFMWTVAPLWFLPLLFLYSELHWRGRLLLALGGLTSLAWQFYLLWDWFPTGSTRFLLFWATNITRRNSLFDEAWRPLLPSFYDFDNYLAHWPNRLAMTVVVLVFAAGGALVRRQSRRHAASAVPQGYPSTRT